MFIIPNYLNSTVIGIDVASAFSFASVLCPDGSQFRKPFKINHTVEGFNCFLEQIKKAEGEYAMKPIFFMESTGVYHLTLFHFLKDNKFDAFIINPLVTNCNKNKDIRKVKNDKNDSLSIAKLGKYEDIKVSSDIDLNIFSLKLLIRDYYKLMDDCSSYKKKLSTSLTLLFSGYQDIFANTCSSASIGILKEYPTPQLVISAPKETIIDILLRSRKGINWAEKKYNTLIECANAAKYISLSVTITTCISLYEAINNEITKLLNEIKSFIDSDDLPATLNKNIDLLMTLGGLGYITAITVLAEIGAFDNFLKPKQLVAFFWC